MELKFKKLHEEAVIPKYQTKGSAGFDFHAVITPDEDGVNPVRLDDNDEMEIVEIVGPGKQRIIDTGLSVAVPEGYELQVRPRSGLSFKHKITVTNSPGTIDSDYRGEIKIIIFNLGEEDFVINKGDRIAQGVVNKIEQFDIQEVDDLDETERGGGGFGSTGV